MKNLIEYKNKNNVVYACTYHVIFCPKYRRKVLIDGVDIRLKDIIYTEAEKMQVTIRELEVMEDHVHILIDVDPQLGIHTAVKRLKGISSSILRKEFTWLKSRIPTLWTNSYFVATTDGVSLEVIKQYIENQKGV